MADSRHWNRAVPALLWLYVHPDFPGVVPRSVEGTGRIVYLSRGHSHRGGRRLVSPVRGKGQDRTRVLRYGQRQ